MYYILVQKTNNQVKFLRHEINLIADEENKKLPNIYWTPNFQKNLSKPILTIAATQCSAETFSKAVSSVLKLIYKQIETYNSKMH